MNKKLIGKGVAFVIGLGTPIYLLWDNYRLKKIQKKLVKDLCEKEIGCITAKIIIDTLETKNKELHKELEEKNGKKKS